MKKYDYHHFISGKEVSKEEFIKKLNKYCSKNKIYNYLKTHNNISICYCGDINASFRIEKFKYNRRNLKND